MKLCPRCEEGFPDDAGFCPFDAQALIRSSDPLLGRTLAGRYRLVRRLGTGGMSLVYLARHVMIDRLSAIKILRQDLGLNPAHRERFLREARAVNRINHPNIVEITDFGEDSGLVFLVMEYVEGSPLLSLVEQGPISFRRAVGLAIQITSALARAHELGVIHRDLKPENVLLCSREKVEAVKLTDFGIAKIVDAPALTFAGQRFGTPGYIAPEYIEGAEASPRGDLYALGVVLYEMLTSTFPFDARYPADLLAMQLRESPIPPGKRVGGVPAELEALIMRLIARGPEERPRDAFEVLDALEEIVKPLGGSQPSGPPGGLASTIRIDGSRQAEAQRPLAAQRGVSNEVPERWEASLAELKQRVDDARSSLGERDPRVHRASELADTALSLQGSLERAGVAVAGHLADVDRLEASGREFRETLGRAIETLSRDRSRERARLEVLAKRRAQIFAGLSAPGIVPPTRDALLAEAGALGGEEETARRSEADLGYQLEVLQSQLTLQNERLEKELADATGRLEGALSAARRVTREIARTREEALRALA